MNKLTDEIVEEYFAKEGLKADYKQFFSEKAKSLYADFQRDMSEEEDNIESSLKIAAQFTKLYAEQREMGHSELWARVYTNTNHDNLDSDKGIYDTVEVIEAMVGKEAAAKEVELHLAAQGKSPLFIERYNYLLFRAGADYRELTQSAQWYCDTCNKLITAGNSEVYAKAYAHMLDLDIDEDKHYCENYAEKYAELIEGGCDENDARELARVYADDSVEY